MNFIVAPWVVINLTWVVTKIPWVVTRMAWVVMRIPCVVINKIRGTNGNRRIKKTSK